jgi:hypothetical protein
MDVIRQYADGIRFEGPEPLNGAIDIPYRLDVPSEQVTRSIGKSNSKEENTALDLGSTVS